MVCADAGIFSNPKILLPLLVSEEQRRLVRQQGVNAAKQSRPSTILSRWSLGISIDALAIVAFFSVMNYCSAKTWQNSQLEQLEKQTLILEQIKTTVVLVEK